MKIILLSDVKNVGKKGDICQVADGYGRNYLIRNGLAVEASRRSMEILNNQKEEQAAAKEARRLEAEEAKKQIEEISLSFPMKCGTQGKLFGSVSTGKIADELQKQYGITVDRKKFVDSGNLTSLGRHDVRIELFKGVVATVKVEITEG